MDTVKYVVCLILFVALFGGVLVWAFGRKTRRRRFIGRTSNWRTFVLNPPGATKIFHPIGKSPPPRNAW